MHRCPAAPVSASPRLLLSIALGLSLSAGLLGCDEEEPEAPPAEEAVIEEPEPTTPEEVPTPTEPEETGAGYTIHEWGLVDIDLGDNTVEYAAGPGHAEPESSSTASNSGGRIPTRPNDAINQAVDVANQLLGGQSPFGRPNNAGRRKPVLYFHLTDAGPDFTFNLTVNLGSGHVIEHFPRSTVEGHSVSWSDVGLRTESCTGGPYPTEESPVCTEVEDDYCEAAELSGYVSSDAGCLTIGGLEQNFLFYRGGGPAPDVPVVITRADDGTITLENLGLEGPVGPVLRLRRNDDGVIQVAQAAMPELGRDVSIGAPTEDAADSHRELIREQLRTIGLTAGEAGAFEQAWFGELFDGEAETPHAFPDAVLFFLPADAIDGYAQIEADPAPSEIVRAMALRAGWTE